MSTLLSLKLESNSRILVNALIIALVTPSVSRIRFHTKLRFCKFLQVHHVAPTVFIQYTRYTFVSLSCHIWVSNNLHASFYGQFYVFFISAICIISRSDKNIHTYKVQYLVTQFPLMIYHLAECYVV